MGVLKLSFGMSGAGRMTLEIREAASLSLNAIAGYFLPAVWAP
jgi:hypothetical protein